MLVKNHCGCSTTNQRFEKKDSSKLADEDRIPFLELVLDMSVVTKPDLGNSDYNIRTDKVILTWGKTNRLLEIHLRMKETVMVLALVLEASAARL